MYDKGIQELSLKPANEFISSVWDLVLTGASDQDLESARLCRSLLEHSTDCLRAAKNLADRRDSPPLLPPHTAKTPKSFGKARTSALQGEVATPEFKRSRYCKLFT